MKSFNIGDKELLGLDESQESEKPNFEEILCQTYDNLKPILDKAPNLKLYQDSDTTVVYQERHKPLHADIVTLQMVLNQTLDEVLCLKAANVNFSDVVGYNK